MLESRINPIIKNKAKRFLRRYSLCPLIAVPLALGCGGNGKGITGPTGPDQSQTSKSTAHYQQTAKTDGNGEALVSVRNFDVKTKVLSDLSIPLAPVDVALVDQGSCYRLMAVDTREPQLYASASIFIPISRLSKPTLESIIHSTNEGVDLNLMMRRYFEGLPVLLENKLVNVKPKDKRSKDARKLDTIPLANLYNFYSQNDALVSNAGIFEFILENSGEILKIPELQFASTLNKERTRFLANISQINNKVMNVLGSYMGKEYDPWAHYWDIFETPTPLGRVLSHQESSEKLCTLRLNMFVEGGGQRIPTYAATRLKGVNVNLDESATTYLYHTLKEGLYTITITEPGFRNISKEVRLITPTPPFFTSTRVDLQAMLDPDGISNPRRRILQAYYESGQAAIWFDFESNTYVRASGEIPPSALYDLYIEPQDPEISSPDLISNRIKNIALVGNVPLNQIKSGLAYKLVSGYTEGENSEGRKVNWGPGSSFVVKTSEGNWAKFIIESLEKEKHKMIITYQITGNSNGIFRY